MEMQMLGLVGYLFIFFFFFLGFTRCEASESKIPEIRQHRELPKKNAVTFSQDDTLFIDFTRKLLSRLDSNCNEPSEVSYRSQQLTSPNRKVKVFFEGSLRRPVKGKRLYGLGCGAPNKTSLIQVMVTESEGKKINLNVGALGFISLQKGYVVINPISFSPNERYMVTRLDIYATITDRLKAYAIFDFQNNYRYLKLSPCKDDQFGGRYQTFKSNTEVIFKCDIETESPYLEIVNLQDLSIRRATITSLKLPSNPISYGSIAQPFSIKP
jgi:hypothetical protein